MLRIRIPRLATQTGVSGTGAGTVAFTGSGAGTASLASLSGAGAGGLGLSATGAGTVTNQGQGAGLLALSGLAAARVAPDGDAPRAAFPEESRTFARLLTGAQRQGRTPGNRRTGDPE